MTHTHVFALFALSTALVTAGCRGDDPAGTATEGESTSEGSSGSPTTGGLPTTGGTSGDGTTTTTTGTPTTTNNSNGFVDPMTTGGTTMGGKQPLGGQCTTDDDCESMNCYTNPLMPDGGVCSECNADQDCVDAMTGISCSISAMEGYAVCEDGSLGDQCMSQDACQDGLFCDAVINVPIPGVIPNTCGECSDSGDCMDGLICSPTVDFNAQSGQKTCVEPMSVPNDSFCPYDQPDGDMACMSGHCTMVSFMAIVNFGVCGECESDADCMGGTCMPGEASMNGLSGSKCI